MGLTWGGSAYPWDSAHVLCTLIIGFALLVSFSFYEYFAVKPPVRPTTPCDILANRTSGAGLISTAIHGLVSIALIIYTPVVRQDCRTPKACRAD